MHSGLHLALRQLSCQRTSEEKEKEEEENRRIAFYLKFPQELLLSELLTAAKF